MRAGSALRRRGRALASLARGLAPLARGGLGFRAARTEALTSLARLPPSDSEAPPARALASAPAAERWRSAPSAPEARAPYRAQRGYVFPVAFPYDEFDLSGVRTYPLADAPEQSPKQRISPRPIAGAQAWQKLAWTAFPAFSPPATSAPWWTGSSEARPLRRVRDHLGFRRSRAQDRTVARHHRSDAARVRVGPCHQRRRDHPRALSRSGRLDFRGRRRGVRVPAASGWPRKQGPCSTARSPKA